MRTFHNIAQRSPEWFELRRKYPLTASHAQAIGNNGKGLETAVMEALAEKYSSGEKERFSNKHTERGNEEEELAKTIYLFETNNPITEIGFVTDEDISQVGGASPDGLIGDEGLIEIKSMEDPKYFPLLIEMKKTGTFKVDSKHLWQMQQQLLFTGRKWCDYVIFNPNYAQPLLIQRILPDEEMQTSIREGLKKGEEIIREIEKNLS